MLGICAQLDLWRTSENYRKRTSENYRNKRFADAIAIWSGGNEVERYIAFVLKRVPGMTRNTVMDDAFWRSPFGIAFLKAQAWHEAGKPYPVPGPTGSRRSEGIRQRAAEHGRQERRPAQADFSADVKRVQADLVALGYHEVGEADGLIGGKTRGGITAFLGDRGVTVAAGISPALVAEIAKAKAEGWSRAGHGMARLCRAAGQGVMSVLPTANDQVSPYLSMFHHSGRGGDPDPVRRGLSDVSDDAGQAAVAAERGGAAVALDGPSARHDGSCPRCRGRNPAHQRSTARGQRRNGGRSPRDAKPTDARDDPQRTSDAVVVARVNRSIASLEAISKLPLSGKER